MTKARTITIDGILFDSLSEGRHYQELKYRKLAGEIDNLYAHPSYIIIPAYNDNRAVRYTADFRYNDLATGRMVIEDVKPYKTNKAGKRVPYLSKDFVLRWKMLQYNLRQLENIDFRIVEG
jgi:hypothetical protein